MKPTHLTKHPEGGKFQEVFRSKARVQSADGRERSALTHIYFELQPGERSRFHKVTSDEVWNLYRGEGIRLYTWDGTETPPECITLSADQNQYCAVIPAGVWQAAEPIADAVLVGCSVAPGFEFEDFTMLEPDTATPEAQGLRAIDPSLLRFVVGE